jgi:hypothetical protein
MAQPIESSTPAAYVLYQKRPVSDVCEHGFVEYFYSKVDARNGVLDFVVEGNSEHVIVPSKTYLKIGLELTGKGTRKDGTEFVTVGTAAHASTVNNLFHSVFETVEVYVANELITKNDKHYGYAGLLQTLCNYNEDAWKTYFQLTGWAKDTAGQMDKITGENSGIAERRALFKGDPAKAELIGKIFSPLFFQEKVLPTQVPLRVVLKKKSNDFVLMHEEGSFEIRITDAVLMVQKVKPVPGLVQSYVQMMEEGNPIPYFLNSPSVNFYTIESGSSQFMRDNLFLGRVPERIVIGMVETDAYHGRPTKNPYNFQHFGLTEICLYKDGVPYPRPMIKMDFENEVCSDAYHHFMTSLGGSCTRDVPMITMAEYMNGYTLFSYDMSPDQMGSLNPGTLLNMNSNIRLEMKFKKSLTANITLLVYYQIGQLMQIHRDRRVTIDFSS